MNDPWTRAPVSRLKQAVLRLWHSAAQRVMSMTAAGMLLSLAVDVLLAARLGAGETMDALIIALTLPLFVDTVSRDSTKFSLVPVFIELHKEQSAERFRRFVSGLINASLVLGAFLIIGLEVAAAGLIEFLGPGLSPEGKTTAVYLMRLCGPIVGLAPCLTVQGVLLNSKKKFSLVALRKVAAPLVVLGAIGFTWSSREAAFWIAGAYSAGFILYGGLLAYGMRQGGYRHLWRVWPRKSHWRKLKAVVSWPLAGFVVRQGSRMVERAIASLVAVGGVSAYYLAFRVFSGVQTIVGISIATTELPDLSVYSAAGQFKRLRRVLRTNLIRGALLTLPVVGLMMVFSEPLVRLLYGRGAFDPAAVDQTAYLLFWLSTGMVFNVLVPVLQSVLYSLKAFRLIFRNMVTIAVFNVLTAWGLAEGMGWGLRGLAAAVALSAAASVGNLLYLLGRSNISYRSKQEEVNYAG